MACYPPSFQVTATATECVPVCGDPTENQTFKFSIHSFIYLLYSPFSAGLKGCSKSAANVAVSVHVYWITRLFLGNTFPP